MTTKFILFLAFSALAGQTFGQPANRATIQRSATGQGPAVQKVGPRPVTNPPPAPQPTDLQRVVVNAVVGDDGKDHDTYVLVLLNDANKRIAGYYGMEVKGVIYPSTTGEYLPGDDETLPITLMKSVPTGQMQSVAGLPLPVLREAWLTDFAGGGSLRLGIKPNGHDTWKIKSFTVTLYFDNDPQSPRRMTWNNLTVTQDSRTRDFAFDNNFNPIQ